MQQQATVLNLPTEIFHLILEKVDPAALLRCRQVCRALLSTIDNSYALQYKVELFAEHQVDCPQHPADLRTRFEMLREYQASWRNPVWRKQQVLYEDLALFNEHVGGSIAWDLVDGVLGVCHLDEMEFIRIPSRVKGIGYKRWKCTNECSNIRDMGMDPSQDLLILASWPLSSEGTEAGLHIRSLVTGAAHPLASFPSWSFQPTRSAEEWQYSIQIYNDTVAVMATGEGSSDDDINCGLFIFNWKTGSARFVFEHSSIRSWCFLNEDLMIHLTDDYELCVVHLGDQSKSLPSSRAGEVICTFELPWRAFDSKAEYERLVSSYASEPHSQVPFANDMQDHLIVLTGVYLEPFCFFVVASRLMELVEQSRRARKKPRRYNWTAWIPECARIVDVELSWEWPRAVHGLKAVVYDSDVNEMLIYDFNQRQARRLLSSSQPTTQNVFFEPSQAQLFSRQVTMTVPFTYYSITVEPADADAIIECMLTEDTILQFTDYWKLDVYAL